MSAAFNAVIGSSASDGVDVGDIGHSLRFRGAQYLSHTNASVSNQKTWTLSAWCKRGSSGTIQVIAATGISVSNFTYLAYFNASDQLVIGDSIVGGGSACSRTTTAVFRDPTAFLHIVAAFDANTALMKVYVNGVEQACTGTLPSNVNYVVNYTMPMTIGLGWNGSYYYKGYISRICFVDGQALDPTSFITFNSTINEWVPKSQSAVKAVVDAGGTNSFMLDFDDATSLTTLGNDFSSKNNDWLLNGFLITAGTTYDHMLDVPGNSYATLNSIYPAVASITNGNLTSGTTPVRATMDALLFDSKWEVTAGAGAVTAGVISATGTTNTTTVTANKVFAFRLTTTGALDYKNVTDGGSWTSITTGLTGQQFPYGITAAANWNFGQAPLHASATYQTAAGGYFFDTTSGYKALCQANLPTPAILNPEQHHNVYTVTKSGNTNFTLDWDASVYDTYFEIKRSNAVGDWYNVDGLRGYDKILKSNTTGVETTDANVISVSVTPVGQCTLKSTLPDGTYVISAWKAGLTASRQTNTDGSITGTVTVSRNVTSGFAIVTYTGTGANATVGHGLGSAPKMVIVKNRSYAPGTPWPVNHDSILATEYLVLNTTAAKTSGSYFASRSSTTFGIDSSTGTNGSGNTHVAYVHAEIPGYSKFGSYTGNGLADGPYVDVGFKAKWLRNKCSTAATDWCVHNALSDPYNSGIRHELFPNLTAAESSDAFPTDFVALGVKSRNTGNGWNTSAATYIYSAYADVTNKYSLGR